MALPARIARTLFREQIAAAATALAYWAWNNREEVVDWAAYGVRSVINLAEGNTDDVAVEGRLRLKLLGEPRTRRAIGLEVQVKDGITILKGMVDPGVREIALRIAESTEGVDKIDDRLEVLHPRPELGSA
jgi:osmotically-inducible protein OsmY